MADDDPDRIQVPVAWIGADEVPVLFANQFIAQIDRGEIFLTVGQLVPPPIMGATEEERREMAENVQFVPVKPVARIAFTPGRLSELISILEITKRNHEQQEQHFGDPRNS